MGARGQSGQLNGIRDRRGRERLHDDLLRRCHRAQNWVKRYHGPGLLNAAFAMALSPDGSTVLVNGVSYSSTSADYATVVDDAATGAQGWVRRYTGPGHHDDD